MQAFQGGCKDRQAEQVTSLLPSVSDVMDANHLQSVMVA